MPIRTIIRYPDPRLAIPAQPVAVFDGALRELAQDLIETMHAAPGIGITAPHIGIRSGSWCSTSTAAIARGPMSIRR